MSRLVRVAVALLAAASVVAGPSVPALAEAGGDAGVRVAGGVVVKRSDQSPESVAAYWTPERRLAAKEVPSPELTAADLAKIAKSAPEEPLVGPPSAPGGLPKGVATAAGGAGKPLSGPRAERWYHHGTMPATTVGRLYFRDDRGEPGRCTAAVINAANANTVWTAGHCVHGGGAGRGWYDALYFEPDFDDGAPLGGWGWKQASTSAAWANDGNRYREFAAVAFWPGSRGRLADVTGYQGYDFTYNNGPFADAIFFGYPAAPRPDFDGKRLFYCTGYIKQAVMYNLNSMDCDMGSGASGGPWIMDFQQSRGWGFIVGTHLGHRDGSTLAYSATHWNTAANVRNAVQAV